MPKSIHTIYMECMDRGRGLQVDNWLSRVDRSGPVYLAILKSLEAAIRDGELQPGDRLPPQRTVARQLGVDFTTVTRAYAAARERGLVEGTVGRGTFVRGRSTDDEAGLVDLGMNLPPPPQGISLAGLLAETTGAILAKTDVATLMAYHPGAGSLGQRTAGAAWLAPCLGTVDPERVLVCAGAQAALAALFAVLVPPGGVVVTEPLTYPGLITLAEQSRVELTPCAVDGEGMVPDALARLCAERRPAAIYCIPTQQNPAAYTMGEARRRHIAAVAAAAGVPVIEDDAYGRLPAQPLPAIARFAPTWHVATLAKCLTPGLRTAFVVAPDAGSAQRAERALRAVSLMPAPLMTAVAARWIREGVAEDILTGVRAEAVARRAIAGELLLGARGDPESLHVWLDLPAAWDGARLRSAARDRGLSLVTADSFAVGPALRNGMRISLGGPPRQAVLREALGNVAGILAGRPERGTAAV
jgi:DNA-binding transcriptional MocR family regulator